MNLSVSRSLRRGLTLLELVMVMTILGVLAAMLLPKFEGMQNAANEAAAASSSVDAAKLIGQYKAIKTLYPDRWDSLTDGTALWTAGSVPLQTRGLHSELNNTTGTAKLTMATLTAAQATALNNAGIVNLLNVNTQSASATAQPGNMFTNEVTAAAGATVAIVNAGTSQGAAIIDHFYRQNLLTSGTNQGTSGTIPTANNSDGKTVLMVFGLGPQNALIPNSMMEAPTYGNANAAYIYNRLLAVFEVTSSKATFKGMLGADGDTLDAMSTRLQSSNTNL